MSRLISLIALLIVIVLIGSLFFKVMVGFFVPLFLAAVLVVIFRPLFTWLEKKLNGRSHLAALATTITAFLTVLIPLGLVFAVAVLQGTDLLTRIKLDNQSLVRLRAALGLELEHADELHRVDWLLVQLNATNSQDPMQAERIREYAAQFQQAYGQFQDGFRDDRPGAFDEEFNELQVAVNALAETRPGSFEYLGLLDSITTDYSKLRARLLGGPMLAQLKEIANPGTAEVNSLKREAMAFLQPQLVKFTEVTTAFVAKLGLGLVIMVLAVYFFFVDGNAMIETVMRLSPLESEYEHELLEEFDRVSRAVVLATILSAVVQGVLAAIGYYFAGLNSVTLLMLITIVMALIPFFGAASVWIPCCIWLALAEERWWAAIGLAIYGAAVVSSIDNVIKALVLHGKSKLHPLFALLSVLGGVMAMGPIGILVGPMIVAFLQTLLNILQRELLHLDHHGTLARRRPKTGYNPGGQSTAAPPTAPPPNPPPSPAPEQIH